jgi:hypothetical protein
MRRWQAEGVFGPGNKRLRNKGRQPLLDAAGLDALAELLANPPPDCGLWSGRKVAAWMSKRIGRPVDPKQGLAYLHCLGFTRQRPRPRHAKAASAEDREQRKPQAIPRKPDEAKQAAFIEKYEDIPNHPDGDEAAMFADALHPTYGRPACGLLGGERRFFRVVKPADFRVLT